jgi:Ca-activated chloride channel family protein
MSSTIQFFYPQVLYIGLPLLCIVIILRALLYRGARYTYSQASTLAAYHLTSTHKKDRIFFVVRSCLLYILVLLMAKPQLVDMQSKITLEGIDIMLVLDVSDSMKAQHSMSDARSKLAIAQAEAIRFVDKRTNDAIGLVMFGFDALCLCPITADKKLLKKIIHDIVIGRINPQGTALSMGIVTAANRLKHSKAKMILIRWWQLQLQNSWA